MEDIKKSVAEIANLYNSKYFEEALKKVNNLLKIKPNNADLHNNKGIILRALKKYNDALKCYKDAIIIDKNNPVYFNNRGNLYWDMGEEELADKDYNKSLDINPKYYDALINLIKLRQYQELHEEAENLCLKALEINKNNNMGFKLLGISQINQRKIDLGIKNLNISQKIKFDRSIEHQIDILKGKEVDTTPMEFIENTFDHYANKFDHHLINILNYSVPNFIEKELNLIDKKIKFENAIDLGCGTGLCGKFLKKKSSKLIGIDISPRILEQADKKNIYDKLICSNFIDYLKKTSSQFDLFVAADVFIYTGEISETFDLIKKRASKESYFIFSIETLKQGNYKLQETGRFSHSENYIKQKSIENSMILISKKDIKVRKEKNEWIKGQLYFYKV
tara:strand:+ start:914 stop:2092 length:1179 start_codon:yes stop_codon:yes gene_type:complete